MMHNRKSNTSRDFYKMLEIEKTASPDEIKRAYQKLAMKWHPDRNLDNKEEATKKFQDISEAYEVLSDEKKKQIYDLHGEEALKDGFGMSPKKENPMDVFRMFFGNGGMPFGNGRMRFSFSQFGDVSSDDDFGFSSLFENRRQSRRYESDDDLKRKSPPIHHDLRVSLEDMFLLRTKRVKVTKRVQLRNGDFKTEEKILEIKMRPGMRNGTKVTFEQEGDQIIGEIPQDIIFKVVVEPHDRFRIEKSNHLEMIHNISLIDALRGDVSFKIVTLDKRELNIRVGEMITPGFIHTIRGEGLPGKDDIRGDLKIVFKIMFPTSLSEEQKAVLAKILPK